MKRALVGVIGLILLGLAAEPVEAQGLRVVVAVKAPPVAARIVLGEPAYLYPYRPYGVWVTDAYLARLHRRHVTWLAREQARLVAMRRHHREYRQAARAFERERARREREIDRAYREWEKRHDRRHRRGR
jgi:hypothetical protein